MTKLERGIPTGAQAEAMRNESVLKGLWTEIYLRNKQRIAEALQKGGKDRETLEKEFSTIPFEELLPKKEEAEEAA